MDFSGLSDDQLLQLIKAVMAEAVQRGAAIARAANDTYVDAAEELRIKAEAEARAAAKAAEAKRKRLEEQAKAEAEAKALQEEVDRKARSWAQRAAIIHALKADEMFRDDKQFNLNIWSRGSDIRIYLQEGCKRGWEIVYYATGNAYNPPKTLTGVNDGDAPRIAKFFDLLMSQWNPGLSISLDQAKNVPPDEKLLKKYKEVLGHVAVS